MSAVIEIIPGREGAALSLDALWREAMSMSPKRIIIEAPAFFERRVRVKINVVRPSGTDIEATGLHEDVLVAFDIALKEARLLTGR